ncbi:MAG: hypothetical protein JWN15_4384 [Firmicutes bacterium]|nr:hypothetical protein [Bacillota bacterium]
MTKRRVAALGALAGVVLGSFIGFAWHTPFRPSTWTDIRNWGTFVVLVLGFSVATYELNLTRRQFAEEAIRNRDRDELLDLQRSELRVTQRLRERTQAEAVRLPGIFTPEEAVAHLINESARPIRDVACALDPGDGGRILPQSIELSEQSPFQEGKALFLPVMGLPGDRRMPHIFPGRAIRVTFQPGPTTREARRILARFTDDSGLHWQLDHHMHLEQLDDREDW